MTRFAVVVHQYTSGPEGSVIAAQGQVDAATPLEALAKVELFEPRVREPDVSIGSLRGDKEVPA